MSEHIAATIADCEGKIRLLSDLMEKLRWFQREFPHTAAAVALDGALATRKCKPRNVVAKKVKAAKKNDRQTDRQSKGRAIEPTRAAEPP